MLSLLLSQLTPCQSDGLLDRLEARHIVRPYDEREVEVAVVVVVSDCDERRLVAATEAGIGECWSVSQSAHSYNSRRERSA